jgi:hypothetical protein
MTMLAAGTADSNDRQADLRRRLSTLCHVIRWTSLAWLMWVLGVILLQWTDRAEVARFYGQWFKRDLSALPGFDYGLGFANRLADDAWRIV